MFQVYHSGVVETVWVSKVYVICGNLMRGQACRFCTGKDCMADQFGCMESNSGVYSRN